MELSKTITVATFRLAPGYRTFGAYSAVAGFNKADKLCPILCQEVNIIEANDTEYCKPANTWQADTAKSRKITMDLN